MLTSLFATSDLARRVAERSWECGSFTSFLSKQPIDVNAQCLREGLKFVVEYAAVVVFDFGDRGSVKLDAQSSEFSRKGILR